jgi:hypothetical protein
VVKVGIASNHLVHDLLIRLDNLILVKTYFSIIR